MRTKYYAIACVLATLLLSACSSYFMVKDPVSGKEFYTDSVSKKGGGVVFKDARTGEEVRLQNSQIQEVTKDQYRAATGKQ
ncbi:MAG: hypothetical protein WDO56_29370 [Gammaproteobacteria bacterium]